MSKSPWINHVKRIAAEKGLSYACALSTPACSESYKNRNVTSTTSSTSSSSSSSSGIAPRTFEKINILNAEDWKKKEAHKQLRANAKPPTAREIEMSKYRSLRDQANWFEVNLEDIRSMKPEDVLSWKQKFNNQSEEFKKYFSDSKTYDTLMKDSKKYEKQSKEKKTKKKQ